MTCPKNNGIPFKTFLNGDDIYQHFHSKHSKVLDKKKKEKNKDPVQCEQCNRTLASLDSLRNHKKRCKGLNRSNN